jgi:hypothetical protein
MEKWAFCYIYQGFTVMDQNTAVNSQLLEAREALKDNPELEQRCAMKFLGEANSTDGDRCVIASPVVTPSVVTPFINWDRVIPWHQPPAPWNQTWSKSG